MKWLRNRFFSSTSRSIASNNPSNMQPKNNFFVVRTDTNGCRYLFKDKLTEEQAKELVKSQEERTKGHHVGYHIEQGSFNEHVSSTKKHQ